MSETHNCGSCVSMRKTDGYCRRTGKYVNALAEKPCWLASREEARQNLPTIGPQEVPPTRYGEGGRYLVPEGTKYCSMCKTVKPLSEFGASRNSADGYNNYCKECFNARQANVRAAYREERAATTERIARKEPAPKKDAAPKQPKQPTPKAKPQQPAAVGLDFRSIAALLIYTSGKASSMGDAIDRADMLIELLGRKR